MVATIAPFAIFFGVSATVALVFLSLWGGVNARTTRKVGGLSSQLDRAGIKLKVEEIVLAILGIAVVLWIAASLLLHPSLLGGLAMLPVAVSLSAGAFFLWVKMKVKRRLSGFVKQLELALRLMAGGLRVGLGLRQSLVLVTEEIPEPAKLEYMRVIGQTNIGVNIFDALDDLAVRMPSNETLMMARVIRIQSQTGGDLGKILEHLAGTIKDRRSIGRKIDSLTSEGKASAAVLMALPLLVGGFICLTQPEMGHALLFTFIGRAALCIVAVLETLGIFTMAQILRVNV
ncbi:MAG: type II secretion system F family protein [Candidatus Eremiobacteraeota bacterium]|nr:type II secretion system F family protein [Candidatus Eremiobacteraeota bacterium]